jgi:hypothetical protein
MLRVAAGSDHNLVGMGERRHLPVRVEESPDAMTLGATGIAQQVVDVYEVKRSPSASL